MIYYIGCPRIASLEKIDYFGECDQLNFKEKKSYLKR
jgi:hypothetical protein